jgi:hypothetical protein
MFESMLWSMLNSDSAFRVRFSVRGFSATVPLALMSVDGPVRCALRSVITERSSATTAGP